MQSVEERIMDMTGSIRLGDDEISERFIRSPGPGGQRVNKVATAVQLRFDVRDSPSLSEPVRQRLLRLGAGRIDKQGVLCIEAHEYRERERNRAAARARLAALIREASRLPKPRKPTKIPRAVQRRRLDTKRRHGRLKKLRGHLGGDE